MAVYTVQPGGACPRMKVIARKNADEYRQRNRSENISVELPTAAIECRMAPIRCDEDEQDIELPEPKISYDINLPYKPAGPEHAFNHINGRTEFPEYLPAWEPGVWFDEVPFFDYYDPALRANKEKPNLLKPGVTVQHITPDMGVILTGVKLQQLSNKARDELALLISERKIVVFRDQLEFLSAGPQYQEDFMSYFGRLSHQPVSGAVPGHPAFHIIHRDDNEEEIANFFERKLTSTLWHQDVSYEKQPPGYIMLGMLACPDVGGDTVFADTAKAYRRLSPTFQGMIENLKAVHSSEKMIRYAKAAKGTVRSNPIDSFHPIVRVHPVTGEKALFLNSEFLKEIVGLKDQEADLIVRFLIDHICMGHDFQARVHWEKHSVVMFDGRTTLHTATVDYDSRLQARHIFRLAAMTEKPISVAETLGPFQNGHAYLNGLVKLNGNGKTTTNGHVHVNGHTPVNGHHSSDSTAKSEALPVLTNGGRILRLSNGVLIPALGFGTYAKEEIKGLTHPAVIAALNAGYRHLDCAWYYHNEAEVGSALREYLSANPNVKRSDIFVTTKVWPHLLEPEDVEWSLNNSLTNLQLDYVDAFLVHWPIAAERTDDHRVKLGEDGKYIINKELTQNLEPTWRAMEKAYKLGKARSIGVSNWTISELEKLRKYAEIQPTINQIEIHPFLPNDELLNYCFSHDILPAAYSPLGSQEQVPITGEKVSSNKALNSIAAKAGISLANLLIAWGLERGYAVVPKSGQEERIRSNASVTTLTPEVFEAVNEVAKGRHHRFVNLRDTFGYELWPEEAANEA